MIKSLSRLPAIRSLLVLGTVSGVLATGAARAQTPSEADIARALTPRGQTRSLTITPISPPAAAAPVASAGSEDGTFVDSLRNKTSRTLSSGERAKLAEITSDKPTVNLEIPFGFNSSAIAAKTLPAVKALGAALSRPEFRGATFTISGHTDGKGGEASNQALSERRAEAVKQYIVQNYGVPATNLISVGYGKTRLKNTADPYSDDNRRVEVTNISDVKSASR